METFKFFFGGVWRVSASWQTSKRYFYLQASCLAWKVSNWTNVSTVAIGRNLARILFCIIRGKSIHVNQFSAWKWVTYHIQQRIIPRFEHMPRCITTYFRDLLETKWENNQWQAKRFFFAFSSMLLHHTRRKALAVPAHLSHIIMSAHRTSK